MPDFSGVHGSSGATDKHRPAAVAGSLDPTLNERAEPPRGAAHGFFRGMSHGSLYRSAHGPLRGWWWTVCAAVSAMLMLIAFTVNTGGAASSAADGSRTVAIGLKLAPTNLDIRNQSGSALDQLLIGNVYEGLVARDESNAVIPAVAQSWDSSADGKTYTFHLHRGMRFSNGDALDANDVAWSITQLIQHRYQGADELKDVGSVRAVDSSTVTITLIEPYADLLWVLTGRPGLVFDRRARYDYATQAVGSGPYRIAAYMPGSSVTLEVNEAYWGEHRAKTDRIVVRYFADDTAAANALKSGDVQVLAPLTQTLTKPFVNDSARYQVKVGDGTDKYVLAFNMRGAKTSDKRVRQAIRYAIDHRQLIASRGGADVALGGPIPSLDPGHENLTSLYPHDVAKAKRLMREAGFDAAHPLRLTLTYASVYGGELGGQLRSQLKPIGIDLHVEVVEFTTWLQDVFTNHDYDLSLVDHNESHDFSSWSDPSYYFGYDNKAVQRLTAEANRAGNAAQHARLLAQAARIVSEDAPADWLFNYRITTVEAVGVQGFPINLNQTVMPLYDVMYTPTGTR